MKSTIFFAVCLWLFLKVSDMAFQDALAQEQMNCEYWPFAFDYCVDNKANPFLSAERFLPR